MIYRKLGVHIKVKSINESLKFYSCFGFAPIFAYGSEKFLKNFTEIGTAPEKYNGVTFNVGEGLLEIADGHLAVKQSVFSEEIKSPKISLMIDTESIIDIETICKSNKIKISVPIKEFPWGTKEIVIKDPDGAVLVFREHLK